MSDAFPHPMDAGRGLPDASFTQALIVGCGDVGLRLGHILMARGVSVSALARSDRRASDLRAQGLEVIEGDLDDPATLAALQAARIPVFHLAPPPGEGLRDTRTGHLLAALDRGDPPSAIIYASTSGVYGDCGGAWVTEDAPLQPGTGRARRRVAAEEAISAWSLQRDVRSVLLRVAGIYGPGRLPITSVRAGAPVIDPSEAPWTNRIHADDLARILYLAAVHPVRGAMNVSDGSPGRAGALETELAALLGCPPPPRIPLADAEAHFPPARMSFLRESRRLDVTQLRGMLPCGLLHPTLRDGLRASL